MYDATPGRARDSKSSAHQLSSLNTRIYRYTQEYPSISRLRSLHQAYHKMSQSFPDIYKSGAQIGNCPEVFYQTHGRLVEKVGDDHFFQIKKIVEQRSFKGYSWRYDITLLNVAMKFIDELKDNSEAQREKIRAKDAEKRKLKEKLRKIQKVLKDK